MKTLDIRDRVSHWFIRVSVTLTNHIFLVPHAGRWRTKRDPSQVRQHVVQGRNNSKDLRVFQNDGKIQFIHSRRFR